MPRTRKRYEDRITQDPRVMVGKPLVKGTRIPVARVLEHLSGNPDLNDLFEAFPSLTLDDVKACLAYAHAAVERSQRRAVRAALAEALAVDA